MKLVTFARAVAPHGAGDKRLVPDRVADRLEAEGVLSGAEPWPASAAAAPAAQKPRRQIQKPERPSGLFDRRGAE